MNEQKKKEKNRQKGGEGRGREGVGCSETKRRQENQPGEENRLTSRQTHRQTDRGETKKLMRQRPEDRAKEKQSDTIF